MATEPSSEVVQLFQSADLANSERRLTAELAERLIQAVESLGRRVERVRDLTQADVSILPADTSIDDQRRTVYGEPYIPVVAVDLRVDSVDADQFDALISGSFGNWIDLGGQDRRISPIAHYSFNWFAGNLVALVDHAEQLGLYLNAYPGLISMVPRSEVYSGIKSLIVDDIDPLRDELNSENWKWWEQVQTSFSDRIDPDVAARIEEVISDFVPRYAPAQTMITVVGDVILGRTVHTIMTQRNDFRAPFHLVTDELQRGDLTIGNLECALTRSFPPPSDPTTFSFMTFPGAIDGLLYAGFHALSGANNHSMDFGQIGIRDTRETVTGAGIQYFGAGNNLAQAREPAILEHNGVRFAFLGYDSISMNYASAGPSNGGIAPMIREHVVDDITSARQQADVVIPYFHWGVEYVLTPQEPSRRMAYAAVDAGADLVLGSHPHWVQGMETYRGVDIFYSLSNFVFDQEWSLETKQSLFLHLIFEGTRFAGFRIVPALIEEFHRPRVVEGEMRDTILERFWRSSRQTAETPVPGF